MAVTVAVGAAAAEFVLEEPFAAAPFLPPPPPALLSFRLDGADDGEGDSDSPLLPFSVRGAEASFCCCDPADAWPFEAVDEAAGGAAEAAACPLTRSSPRDSEWCSSLCDATGPDGEIN